MKKINNDFKLPPEMKKNLTIGQRAADFTTKIVGSWTFILTLFAILLIWIIINALEIIFKMWDPYPFILLNFVLSCLAAVQAPIIMMSQNRQSERDRMRQHYDYLIDRKAERGIQKIQIDIEQIKKQLNNLSK